MSTKEQSVTLLRRNKRAQVAALRSIGFDVTDDMKASDFPRLVRIASGLYDITVAVRRISDGVKLFLNKTEWSELSITQRLEYLIIGLRIRANGLSFILAAESRMLAWGSNTDVTLNMNYGSGTSGLYDKIDALTFTKNIAAHYSGITANGVTGAPAAEYCLSYKAFTTDADGIDDDTQWSLPAPCHLMVLYRYRTEINEFINLLWSSDYELNQTSNFYSCCEYSSSQAFILSVSTGRLYADGNKLTEYVVRPISILNT